MFFRHIQSHSHDLRGGVQEPGNEIQPISNLGLLNAGQMPVGRMYIPSIFCSNARAPVAQLVRASDRHFGLSPGWVSMHRRRTWGALFLALKVGVVV